MAKLPDLSSLTREAIFAGYERDANEGFRTHLGASLIGKACERALWYDFRWTTKAKFPGRVLRLFETGIRDLRGLIEAWREARQTAWQTTVKVLTTGVLAALLVGIAIKLRLMGGPQ